MRTAGLTLLAALALGVGCGGAAREPPASETIRSPTTTATAPEPARTTPAPRAAASLADAIRPLPPASAGPAAGPRVPLPVRIDIEALGVEAARIVPVGVEPDGEMEIPGPAEVGWYRFGARPGDGGSTVLVAHIAYDGVDGVFRHLDDLESGDEVVLGLADGSTRRYTVTAVDSYPKSDLPDDIFTRTGDPRLALVTCGGDFDRHARRYEDNIVAHARPA